jgi:hypothetical protein
VSNIFQTCQGLGLLGLLGRCWVARWCGGVVVEEKHMLVDGEPVR